MNDKREPMKTEEERAKEYLECFTNIVKGIQKSEHNYIIWNFIENHKLNEFEGKNGAKMILITITEEEARDYEHTRKGWWG